MPDDLIADYLERLEMKNYSAHTLRAYRSDLRQAEAALGAPLHLVVEHKLEAYAAGLSRKLAPTSVRRKHAALREFFEYTRRAKVRTDDPTVGFEAPKLEDRLPVHLNDTQIAQLLGTLRGNTPADRREAVILKAFYYTGMRACELARLDVEDLLFDQKEIRVFGKGKRERMLPMSPQLGAALFAYLDDHPTKAGALFIRLTGERTRLGYDAIAAIVKAAGQRVGLVGRKFSCHKLRHTFATRLINRKVSINKIQKLMGHRRIDTTTIYANTSIDTEVKDEVNKALG